MIPPTSIDGTDITGATIDGTDVQEITVDGQTVFSAVDVVDNAELSPNGPYSPSDTISTYYTGNTGDYFLSSSRVFEGSRSIEHTGTNSTERIISLSGLPNYPQSGDIFEFYMDIGEQFDGYVLFGAQNIDDYYEFGYRRGDLRLAEYDSGQTILDSTPQSLSEQYYRFEVDWKSTTNNIIGKVFETNGTLLATVSDGSSTYSSGGIGFKNLNTNNAQWNYDGFVIK